VITKDDPHLGQDQDAEDSPRPSPEHGSLLRVSSRAVPAHAGGRYQSPPPMSAPTAQGPRVMRQPGETGRPGPARLTGPFTIKAAIPRPEGAAHDPILEALHQQRRRPPFRAAAREPRPGGAGGPRRLFAGGGAGGRGPPPGGGQPARRPGPGAGDRL